MLFSTSCVPLAVVVFCFWAELSYAFTGFAVISDVKKVQWEAEELCVARGYGGLAVIDTPFKWDLAKALLDYTNLPAGREVWIGLEADPAAETEASWRGSQAAYTGGPWAVSQPDWGNNKVLVTHDGTSYVWKTQSPSYENEAMCDYPFSSMTMSKHPNNKADLSSATPILTTAATSPEDCGMTCTYMNACAYVTHDVASADCVMYDASVSSLLNTNNVQPNSFNLYAVVAHK